MICLAILFSACTTPISVSETPSAPAAAATSPAANLFPLTITDATGQEFTFDAPPKIGCHWGGCHEIFAELGLPPHAARTWASPEEMDNPFYFPAGLPTHWIEDGTNPEDWAAAEVELIIDRLPVDPDNALDLAAPTFYLHFPSVAESAYTGYEAYLENLRLVGQLANAPEQTAAVLKRLDTLAVNLKQVATPETAQLSVAVIWAEEGYHAIGNVNPFCTVIAEAGVGTCVESPWYDEINAEVFLALDPDWIAYMPSDHTSFRERQDPIWEQLTAVKEGRVYDTTTSRYDCCGTRVLVHALQDYVSHILPNAGIPSPGPEAEFDPTQSPLVKPQE